MTDRIALLGVALWLASFVVYNANGREIGSYDSQATKLLAVEIAKRHSLSLGHVVGRTPALGERPAFMRDREGNYRLAYPLPSALVAGAVAWAAGGAGIVDLDSDAAPAVAAKLTASALTALATAFAFVVAARRTSRGRAIAVSAAFGFGTNMWASVSQTLWQQETALSALMIAIALLTAERPSLARCVGAGALLGIAGWARPQVAPSVLVLAVSMIVRCGPRAIAGLVPLAAAAVTAMSLNLSWFGHVLGAVPAFEALHPAVHDVSGSIASRPWVAAAGLLFSPSRGLLIFSPVVAFAIVGLAGVKKEGWRSDLRWCATAAVAQFALYATYAVWWGGHTYGPRYALDVLPSLVPIAAVGMQAIASRGALTLLASAAFAWSIGVSALGAFVYPAEQWNSLPVDVDRNHERLWDWRDSQIQRCLTTAWNPENFSLFRFVGAARRTGPIQSGQTAGGPASSPR